ncbi:small ribosomal subunit protein mS39 [Periplaneta americana]|uniref:small ribosomal subunit protein mS39 n=1 Tax=Periplaneta americana TaxID=6978 RepID=UPI0037E7F905
MNSLNTLRLGLRSQHSRQLNGVQNVIKQYSSAKNEEIIIPKRIHRGPTDILRVLASTVKPDPTAPHYKYHDDPYLTPQSNVGKRSFALSKESGRKAAQWIRAQNAELFQHKVAFPPVEAFYPRAVYDENSEVDEEVLKQVIKDVLVSDAITVYQLLEKNGKNISHSTKQSLLELLCFFNCEDTLPEDMIEERWFRHGVLRKDKHRKTWKDNGLAEAIFRSFESPDSVSYCTLLQGMTRYYQVDRAWHLYEEMKEKRISLTRDAYNSLIRVVCFLREGNEHRWQLIQELLTEMSKQKMQPNTGTLNAVLEAVSSMGSQKHVKTYALRLLAEMRRVGVQPSLASYYYLLITFCKERGPISTILVDIMNAIEGQTFTIQDPKDTFFFVTAMDICRNHLQDLELAHRVDRLLHVGDNYDLIGDSFKESIYYRHYFVLLCNMEPLEVFMGYYNKLVPHIYIPEPAVMEEVIKAVDMNGAAEHFPKLWSDMVIFDHIERANNVAAILSGMVKYEPQEPNDLTKKFSEIALDAWNKLEVGVDEEKYRQFRWTGPVLGNIMILCLRGGKFDNALDVLNKLEKDQNNIVGIPTVEALQSFIDACVSQNKPREGIQCIQYAADAGFPETGKFAQHLSRSLDLNAEQVTKLTNIVGQEVIQATKTESAAEQ